ncbi:MAG TPA: 3-methyl-2-oxobutanoate hydroxymethyltransferase, partial [Syntrophales bacterium]|nr:3-methyl-2-oxobutanoate hydroxymethyltransferase [Syntrophales bacterium]
MAEQKITTSVIREKKIKGEKITMLTAYDYATAIVLDESGVDIILVGDSLGMVVLGYDSTLP